MNRRFLTLIIGDILCACSAVIAAFWLRYNEMPDIARFSGLGGVRVGLFVFVMIFSAFFVELYHPDRELKPREASGRIFLSLVISFFALSSVYYLFPAIMYSPSRRVLALSLAGFGLLQFLWHVGSRGGLIFPGFSQRILILGTGPLASQIGNLVTSSQHNYTLSGYVTCPHEPVYVPASAIVGTESALYETVCRQRAHQIVVSLNERRGVFPLRDVLNCKMSGVDVVDAPSFYESVTGKLLIENISPSWFIFSQGFRVTAITRFVKRGIDICCALVGSVLVLPFVPIIALAIKLDSPGQVLFGQERVGERGKPFFLYKFRTMRQDAEAGTGAVWAQKDDPRVTRLGRFLRKSRIDEIPQFINVLRGDMSLVGPRPERPEFVEKLNTVIPYYSERHYVKPGVTGWAQVRYPYGASVEDAVEKLRYDLYYIKNLSVIFDLMIILETIKVVLFQRGGR
ncbi:TIGR03013 family XrtA/PEP-CTERM system glycosyltransferase [Geobacter pickeringii]|uniref:Glycosyl transferase n=1 Tax=Geobacter pickeringii TaxID=345632 RepID=A0A0B5BA75_9BACT|nr:TIGR03013 family XrtA/PEP-CTERM system glycosyltransferase [Geobacter pickeringii]AJE03487.1 glycosyl transferase [Geobacter pickeringii]